MGSNVVEIFNPKTKEKLTEYYIDERLKRNLDEKVIKALSKKDKDCVVVFDGREGCLFEDTLIKTDKGNKYIKDLDNGQSFFVKSINFKTNTIEKSKAICIKSGIKELFELQTDDGRKIKATSDHTFFILRNSKVYELPLSKLEEGDELICQ